MSLSRPTCMWQKHMASVGAWPASLFLHSPSGLQTSPPDWHHYPGRRLQPPNSAEDAHKKITMHTVEFDSGPELCVGKFHKLSTEPTWVGWDTVLIPSCLSKIWLALSCFRVIFFPSLLLLTNLVLSEVEAIVCHLNTSGTKLGRDRWFRHKTRSTSSIFSSCFADSIIIFLQR